MDYISKDGGDMIIIHSCLGILRYEKDYALTDIILDVSVTDDFYAAHELDKEEYPEDKWELWLTQDDCDRKAKHIRYYLSNGGNEVDKLTEEDKATALKYIQDNGLDIRAGFIYG